MNIEDLNKVFKTIKGMFSPEQMSSRLFMNEDDIPNNYTTMFHERFHYLQCIFTPYGHLKWGCYRSYTAEVIELWLKLTHDYNVKKKIPIYQYLEDNDSNGFKVFANIHIKDIAYKCLSFVDGISLNESDLNILKIHKEKLFPFIKVNDIAYTLNGIDIIESFAKFEEALLAYYYFDIDFNDTINPDILDYRYYIALYYFVDQVGIDRIMEFPIACELSLAFSNAPISTDEHKFRNNHPGWRFLRIVNFLKEHQNLNFDISSNQSFFEYTEAVLRGCDYILWEELWAPAEKYASECDLSMSVEMLNAIKYKKANPWCLSYGVINPELFFSEDFNRFFPLFTITDDNVIYNTKYINSSELLFENEFQAIACQICGHKSKYNIFPDMLQCADSYFGIKSCKYRQNGKCDGHINSDSELPTILLDENNNITEGCPMEIILNIMGTSITEIDVCNTKTHYSLSDIEKIMNKNNIS